MTRFKLLFSILFSLIVIFGTIIVFLLTSDTGDNRKELKKDDANITITAEYDAQQSVWNYTAKGEQSVPCSTVEVTPSVSKDRIIDFEVVEVYDPAILCAQQVTSFEVEGKVAASKNAAIGTISYKKESGTVADIPNSDAPLPNESPYADNFDLSTNFSNGTWTYTIDGFLPNPCYSASVEEFIAESFPEQVSIVLTLEEPEADTICSQVLEEYSYEGSFEASENATVELEILSY